MAPRLPLPTSDWVKARTYHLLAPFVALALVPLFANSYVGRLLEDQTVNLRFRARAPYDPPADPRLVLVGIDQQSLDKFGQWPWPRSKIGDFMTELAKADDVPHTVAFDILYTENSPDPTQDQSLADGAGQLASVITGALLIDSSGDTSIQKQAEERTQVDLKNPGPTSPLSQIHGDAQKIRGSTVAIFPIPSLRKQSLFAFVNDEPSKTDYIRHVIPLVIRVKDQVYPSLALQILCQMLNVDPDKVEVNVGRNVILRNSSGKSWTIPITERGEYWINYRSNESINKNCLSFGRLATSLEDNLQKGIPLPPACLVQQKTLVVGQVATGLDDLGPTPIQPQSPLVYTHLNVINNVLKNDYLSFVPWYWVVFGWALITWPTLLRLKDAPLGEAVMMPIALVLLYILVGFAIFWLWSLQIALSWPVISYTALNFGGVVLRWREEQRGREHLKGLFSRMLSPEVMHHLLEHPENVKLGGSDRHVTIFFSDIRDFTKISEKIEKDELVRQLNVYFERMVECVKGSRGTFHKYIGDAIMAAWGDIAVASLGTEEDARNAVRSALLMRQKLRELNEQRKTENLLPLRIGMGLNHGEVLVGLIGASSRSEFTVMGDPVNVASRLEGMTKEFKTDLAVSESVRELLGDEFLVRRLGLIQLKGKTTPTVVYEVLAEKNALQTSSLSPEMVAQYERAFDHFLARRFTEAEADFSACEKLYPNDHCVQIYLKACREFLITPPPPEWDGRIVMETK